LNNEIEYVLLILSLFSKNELFSQSKDSILYVFMNAVEMDLYQYTNKEKI